MTAITYTKPTTHTTRAARPTVQAVQSTQRNAVVEAPKPGAMEITSLEMGLERLLADSYVLLFKTQTCHWNISGPLFAQLHALFESQYREIFSAIDDIAEQLRAMRWPTPTQLDALQAYHASREYPHAGGMPGPLGLRAAARVRWSLHREVHVGACVGGTRRALGRRDT